MGNCRSLIQILPEEEIADIQRETGFKKRQIVRLYTRFLSLDKEGRGYVDRDDFFTIPELVANPLGDRIIDAFFAEKEESEKQLTFREFIRVMAHFRPCSATTENAAINSRTEKLKFAFAMYDLNKNGYITKNEFKVILNMMIGSNITSEQLESITDRTITEGDYEKNGKISFEEFARAMDGINVEQLMSIRFLE
uniref:EF-hand domain-containing protein n=1 Tax=Setaria digitata TaxID=48799 RepID=A0A915Q543_9BILA